MGPLVQPPPPSAAHRKHPTGRGRTTIFRQAGPDEDRRIICLNQPPANPARFRALACQNPIKLIDNGGDMKIFVGIDTADDMTARFFLISLHTGSPGPTKRRRFHQSRMPGQDSNATERQALLGSHASVRQNLTARRSSRPTDPAQDTTPVDQYWGQGDWEHLAAPAILRQIIARHVEIIARLPAPAFLSSVLNIFGRPWRASASVRAPSVTGVAARIGLELFGARIADSGSIRTGVQGQVSGAAAAAGEFGGRGGFA